MSVSAPGRRFLGTTSGVSNSAGSCGGGAAPEAVYRVVLTVASDLFVTTHGTRFDTVIYVRNGCCGTELACNNDIDGRRTSALSATNLPAGNYDVFVDGATAADVGAFSVDIFVSPKSSSPGDSCGRPAHIADMPLTGNTCVMRDDAQGSCQANAGGADAIYYFVLDQATMVSFNTCSGTCIDTVLSVRDVCTDGGGGSERACNDDGPCSGCMGSPGSQSRVSVTLTAGVHYVIVDTFPGMPCGAYTLTPISVPP